MRGLTQSKLKAIIHYNPETGVFTRHTKTPRAKVGEIKGSKILGGYLVASIYGERLLLHRIAFLYMTGALPPHDVDHINGVRHDNRWINLRAVNRATNSRNCRVGTNNTSGMIGVRIHRPGTWVASITVNGKARYLGSFKDFFEAACARKSAERKYDFHPNHGRTA